MRVLIACEVSGRVRDAFRAKGHDAWSCDVLPAKSEFHLQGDMFDFADRGWDLLIAHPPCTFLSNAGLHYCKPGRPGSVARRIQRNLAVEFVQRIWALDIPQIAIENPPGYLNSAWQKPTQTVCMNWFGHSEAKKPTSLWLKGLPGLKPSKMVDYRMAPYGKRVSEWYAKTRGAKNRSVTFQGFAEAMADQWG